MAWKGLHSHPAIQSTYPRGWYSHSGLQLSVPFMLITPVYLSSWELHMGLLGCLIGTSHRIGQTDLLISVHLGPDLPTFPVLTSSNPTLLQGVILDSSHTHISKFHQLYFQLHSTSTHPGSNHHFLSGYLCSLPASLLAFAGPPFIYCQHGS